MPSQCGVVVAVVLVSPRNDSTAQQPMPMGRRHRTGDLSVAGALILKIILLCDKIQFPEQFSFIPRHPFLTPLGASCRYLYSLPGTKVSEVTETKSLHLVMVDEQHHDDALRKQGWKIPSEFGSFARLGSGVCGDTLVVSRLQCGTTIQNVNFQMRWVEFFKYLCVQTVTPSYSFLAFF